MNFIVDNEKLEIQYIALASETAKFNGGSSIELLCKIKDLCYFGGPISHHRKALNRYVPL